MIRGAINPNDKCPVHGRMDEGADGISVAREDGRGGMTDRLWLRGRGSFDNCDHSIDLARRTADILVDAAERDRRRAELSAVEQAITTVSQTSWQEIQRGVTGQADTGAVLEPGVKYQRIAQHGFHRDSHS